MEPFVSVHECVFYMSTRPQSIVAGYKDNFTLLISTMGPVYLLYALTIGHICDSNELKCYFNSHVCTGLMYPLHTHDPDVQNVFV